LDVYIPPQIGITLTNTQMPAISPYNQLAEDDM